MLRLWSLMMASTVRNPRRSLLTVGSVAVSLCLLSVLAAAYRSLFLEPESAPAEALRLVTHHRVSITQPMPVSFLPKITRIPGVRDSMIWQWFGGTYKDARDPRNFFARFAVEPNKFFRIKPEVELAGDQKAAFQNTRSSCIVGKTLAARFQWKIGARIRLPGDIFPVTLQLTLVGVYSNPNEDANLYFGYEYLRQLLIARGQSSRADAVGVFLTSVDRAGDVDAVASAIDKESEDSPAPTKSESERMWQLSFVSFLGNLQLFLLSISAALTFTILLVSGNTISMSVRERTREVGVLKTLGFTREMILGMFMGETVLMSIAGGIAGVLLGAVLAVGIRYSGTPFATLRPGFSAGVGGFVIAIAVLIGVLSSFIPARQAARSQILDALRYSG